MSMDTHQSKTNLISDFILRNINGWLKAVTI